MQGQYIQKEICESGNSNVVEQWKECEKCGKDYPVDFHLNHCILHKGGKLVIKSNVS